MLDRLLEHKATVIIYAAGALGHVVYDTLVKNNIIPKYFCSGLRSGYIDSLTGMRVIQKNELAQYSDSIVILAIGDTASEEEKEQLRRVYLQKLAYMVEYFPVEFESSNIMYVDSDIVKFSNHEIVIDAGGI